jgi:urease accessory protein
VSIILTQKLSHHAPATPSLTLWLTAEERTRTRHRFEAENGTEIFLRLPRGTSLQDGDLLASDDGNAVVKIGAKPEPVITITSDRQIDLLRAAYHLGNRHVSLEIMPTYIRLAPDGVLEDLIHHLGLQMSREVAPFLPESGAYSHHH